MSMLQPSLKTYHDEGILVLYTTLLLLLRLPAILATRLVTHNEQGRKILCRVTALMLGYYDTIHGLQQTAVSSVENLI